MVESDDRPLLAEMAGLLGPEKAEPPETVAGLAATIRGGEAAQDWGYLRFEGEGDHTPEDLLLGLQSPETPFQQVESPAPWTSVAFRGEADPMFSLQGEHCLFRKVPEWRRPVALLLFQRLLRRRKDALFFHAASLGIGGKGVLLVGPKGTGKSTLALALAVRGHDFLGDEYAGYLPATGELIPFRRPVGIKPGPRAAAVEEALRRCGRSPEREGVLRMAVEPLLGLPQPLPVPLRVVLFLKGFLPEPRLERVEPGREELSQMQPSVSSLVSDSQARRVMQMARLLASARVHRLFPGDPDETAALIETAAEAW